MPRGERRVETEGINGEEMLRWLVTFAGGRQTERRLIDSTVTRQPQHRVIVFGSQGMGPGRGPGRGHGHWPGRGHRRECGKEIGACLPFGRNACPTKSAAAGSPAGLPNAAQSSAAQSSAAQSSAAKSNAALSSAAQSKAAQSNAAGSNAAQTDATQPKGGEMSTTRAKAVADGVQLGGSIMVTDEDLALLTPADLDAMGIDRSLLCP
jgi:hypothetical protein